MSIYGSRDKLIEATGKEITVNGKQYLSCGSAAKYIVEQESSIGNTRKQATISKELRRYLQGKRGSWVMYSKYLIV